MTMNEKIVNILDALIKDIKRKEDHTYEQIGFCNTHKFEIEREALRYQQRAYNRCWLDLTDARERIVKLMKKTE